MKVLQVIDCLNVGGAERVLVDLSNLLQENGSDVTVLCLLNEAVLDSHLNTAIPVIYLRRKNKYNPFYLVKLYSILSQFDIIHIHLRQVLRYISLLFYATRLHKSKVVVFHDHFGSINTQQHITPSIRKALKCCKAYIGVSDQLTGWAEQNNVNNTVYKLTNIVRPSRGNVKSKLSSEQINIVSVGNFRPQKNYEFLCRLIAHSPKNFHYTIYGQIVDANYYNEIKSLIKHLKIADNVRVITDCNTIQTELPKYHLGVHCATSETGPLVAIEYLSVPIPFVAYNTGEVAKDVSRSFPIFIQNDFNVENWTTNMARIVNHREDYIDHLKSYFSQNYSEDRYVEKCLSIYHQLLIS
jgi:glycosyltransferase involved in cell wall biosynthesis